MWKKCATAVETCWQNAMVTAYTGYRSRRTGLRTRPCDRLRQRVRHPIRKTVYQIYTDLAAFLHADETESEKPDRTMKLIPVQPLIRDKKLLLIDDSIVRGTQFEKPPNSYIKAEQRKYISVRLARRCCSDVNTELLPVQVGTGSNHKKNHCRTRGRSYTRDFSRICRSMFQTL